jgi:hypothetical protein
MHIFPGRTLDLQVHTLVLLVLEHTPRVRVGASLRGMVIVAFPGLRLLRPMYGVPPPWGAFAVPIVSLGVCVP